MQVPPSLLASGLVPLVPTMPHAGDQCDPPRRRFRIGPRSEWFDRAHGAVRDAIDAGELTRPDRCDECGMQREIVAHHDDYARPLDVRWLCRRCHLAWHKANGHGANSFAEGNA